MQLLQLLVVVSTLTYPLLTNSEITPSLINKFELGHPGFLTLLRSWVLNSTAWTLAISCFNPLPETVDYVYNVPDIGRQITTQIVPMLVTDKIVWPNGVVAADPLVEYSMIVPSGFLVPGKNNGNLYFISDTNAIPLVPNDGKNWFYHDADFKDMDGDGFIDIVAARANVPIFGNPRTQLIWLKNPGNTTIVGPWKLNYLLTDGGPDIQTQFAIADSLQVRHIDSKQKNSNPFVFNTIILGSVC